MTMAAPPPAAATAADTTTANAKRTALANDYDDDPLFATLESVTRVAVSGLGGFLVGLSLARRGAAANQTVSAFSKIPRGAAGRGESAAARSKAAVGKNETFQEGAAAAARSESGGGRRLRRQRIVRSTPPTTGPLVDQELPYTWAIAVASFAGILEVTRITSPASIAWNLARGGLDANDDSRGDETDSENAPASRPSESGGGGGAFDGESLDPSIKTISDFVVGGSVAGAIFRGSAVRTRVGARIDASIMGVSKPSAAPSSYLSAARGRPLSGLLPGAALGLLAGVATVAADRARVAAEDHFGRDDGDDYEVVEAANEDGDPIPADIKAMSNEELTKSIENLRSGKSESHCGDEDGREEESSGDLPRTVPESPERMEVGSRRGGKGARDLIFALGFRPHPSK